MEAGWNVYREVLRLAMLAVTVTMGTTGGAAAAQSVKPGRWKVLVENGGVSAMHMTTTHTNTVLMFDRTDFGPSQLMLDNGRCRDDPKDLALTHDCWAHSIEYNVATNRIRPLMVRTDTWCSSGAFAANGTLVHTGGYNDGARAIRYFVPCATGPCDWDESHNGTQLSANRWYASNQILPDNRIIVVGGTKVFSYEFVPKRGGEGALSLPFLSQTNTPKVENNLYPFLHLSSDGNLFIFANKDSILFDYKNNRVVRTFPSMPGGGPRNYPSTGSSVLLPLSASDGFRRAEVLICGGAPDAAFAAANANPKNFLDALQSCGRMVITDADPSWTMENMPAPRVLGDMLVLPNGEVLVINGAQKGVAGWELGRDPALSPFLYRPGAPAGSRFTVLAATTIPRMYHSTANVLPDGRILVGGSNPHAGYAFSGVLFPTELRLEAYSPYYLEPVYAKFRPRITSLSSSSLSYGASFHVTFSVPTALDANSNVQFNVYAPPFTTHSNSMNQRLLVLAASTPVLVPGSAASVYSASVTAPPTPIAAPPGFYMLFVVNRGIPSAAQWVRFS